MINDKKFWRTVFTLRQIFLSTVRNLMQFNHTTIFQVQVHCTLQDTFFLKEFLANTYLLLAHH